MLWHDHETHDTRGTAPPHLLQNLQKEIARTRRPQQRVQRAKDKGEAGLHPHQPRKAEVGDASEGLAVEQLGVLRNRGAGSG